MKAVDVLARDHERIKAILELIGDAMRELETAPRPDVATWGHLLDTCEQWIDKAHVLKEEQGLFPILRSRGLGPEITVVAALMSQHQTGQAFLRELRRAVQRLTSGDEAARHDVLVWARDYLELMREHMRIEDHYFYELADGTLSPADDAALVEKFARIDRTMGGSAEDRRRWAAMLAGTSSAARQH